MESTTTWYEQMSIYYLAVCTRFYFCWKILGIDTTEFKLTFIFSGFHCVEHLYQYQELQVRGMGVKALKRRANLKRTGISEWFQCDWQMRDNNWCRPLFLFFKHSIIPIIYFYLTKQLKTIAWSSTDPLLRSRSRWCDRCMKENCGCSLSKSIIKKVIFLN